MNFAEWAGDLLGKLQRLAEIHPEPDILALRSEILEYPNIRALQALRREAESAPMLLVPCILDLPTGRISLFTTLTTFGTPREITLAELCLELFYPADQASEDLLRDRAWAAPQPWSAVSGPAPG